jgi:hypothetical protein
MFNESQRVKSRLFSKNSKEKGPKEKRNAAKSQWINTFDGFAQLTVHGGYSIALDEQMF